jgi:hypothetical protein
MSAIRHIHDPILSPLAQKLYLVTRAFSGISSVYRQQTGRIQLVCLWNFLCRNCLLQGIIEGKIKWGIEVTGRRERRRRKLLDDFKERRGYSHLKEEALVRTMWRVHFGRGFGPVVRQTDNEWMNLLNKYIQSINMQIHIVYRSWFTFGRLTHLNSSEKLNILCYVGLRKTLNK